MLVFELIFSMFLYKKIIVYCQNIILICFEIYYFCKKYFMDLALIILGIILIILGIGRCFLPVIPGPPLSFAALILLQFTEKKTIYGNRISCFRNCYSIGYSFRLYNSIVGNKAIWWYKERCMGQYNWFDIGNVFFASFWDYNRSVFRRFYR